MLAIATSKGIRIKIKTITFASGPLRVLGSQAKVAFICRTLAVAPRAMLLRCGPCFCGAALNTYFSKKHNYRQQGTGNRQQGKVQFF